ncbi:MFS transporter [Streptomyces sp. NPDC046909]|uniref:MFS transporter n=1 Tax=Streptomyces sp. NPDC046909 TaxID=3155617 RepID=UPI0033DB9A6E
MTEEATEATKPAAPPGRGGLWRHRDFLVFWTGETLSLYGTQVTTLALPLAAVLTFDASAEELGVLRFVQLVPFLGLAMLFGVWVDRVRKRPVMIGANAVRMVLIALVPILAALDVLNTSWLYALAFGIGVGQVLFDVSWMSYVPVLVRDREQLVEANTKLSTTSSSADVAGPGVAGVLVNALSAPTAMAVNAVTYLISIVSLMTIKTREPEPPRAEYRSIRRELAEGLKFVFGNRLLRAIALIGCVCNFFSIMINSLFLLYAVRGTHLSAAAIGLVLGVGAVGGLVGSAVSGLVIRSVSVGKAYLISVSGIFVAPLLIPAASGSKFAVTGVFIASFLVFYASMSVANVVIVSLRQSMTPDNLMARMTAAMRTMMHGGGALGGPVGGLLAGVLGLHEALWTAAVLSALMLIPIALSPVSRLREMPTRPAAVPVDARGGVER